jgi:hypothetical protein
MNYYQWASTLSENITIYLPESWQVFVPNPENFLYYDVLDVESILSNISFDSSELIIVNTLQNIITKPIEKNEFNFVFENEGKIYTQNNLIFFAYSPKLKLIPNTENFTPLDNFYQISMEDFLFVNQNMVSALNQNNPIQNPTNKTFGNPIIMSENVHDSVVCGPALVDKESHIDNSYIGAGSIIIKTKVHKSKILNSFLFESDVVNSNLEDSILSKSNISGLTCKSLKLPSGSEVRYDS